MIGIIDYDAGNIKSVERALAWLNQESVVSTSARGQGRSAGSGVFRRRHGEAAGLRPGGGDTGVRGQRNTSAGNLPWAAASVRKQ